VKPWDVVERRRIEIDRMRKRCSDSWASYKAVLNDLSGYDPDSDWELLERFVSLDVGSAARAFEETILYCLDNWNSTERNRQEMKSQLEQIGRKAFWARGEISK